MIGLGRSAGLATIAASALTFGPSQPSQPSADHCARLLTATSARVEILSATHVEGGAFAAAPGENMQVPASCRIVAVARPTSDSEIGFELWLPDGWNGRYSQLGNGGFAGNIDHPSLASEIGRGNAAAMTDTGHKGSQFDASWALGHPEKVVDYGYRSIKETSEAARELISDYYGRPARRRYFIGCSNGGRQALMAAQRYPADWDGIIAGSPAVEWTRQLAVFAAIQHRLRTEPKNWIPASKLAAIQRAATTACPDAAAHGAQCHLDVRTLVCRGKESANCLTTEQAKTLDLIQSGRTDPPLGQSNLGFAATSAAIASNWEQWILNPDRSAASDLTFATQAFRYLVLERPDWEVEDLKPRRDLPLAPNRKFAGRRLSDILDPANPDLSAFERRAGKLIMYVGWADAVISPAGAVAYYQDVTRRMGMARTQGFARLFVAPGMQHCQGGPSPNAFGQAWIAPALRKDASHDIRLALEAWVEQGRPPTSLTAVKYEGDRGGGAPVATQVLRPYPRTADKTENP